MNDTVETAPVMVSEFALAGGKVAGKLTLNKPKSLNALDLDMAQAMLDALQQFEQRDEVALVFIDAAGDKAFCAGGDIVTMYRSMEAAPGEVPDFIERFFALEYRLDYTIHTFSKPVVVWGHGIVMGGGMGLLNGASHRVVTASSRLAMPEITIGLYPDVGGSYFLPRLPGHSGLFLGLTGASINATDACYLNLADHYCDADQKQWIIEQLGQTEFSTDNAHEQVSNILSTHETPAHQRVEAQVEPRMSLFNKACDDTHIAQIADNILQLDASEDKWLNKAQQALGNGSAITANLVFEQVRRGADMSLADCFKMEMTMSCHCGEYGELQEGVRALLIDKDFKPNWKFSRIADVPEEVVSHFFSPLWDEQQHPLADLGAQ